MSGRFILIMALFCLLLVTPCRAEKTVTELRQIAQAGGSLIVDMDERRYTLTDLVNIAAALTQGATLTIKTEGEALSVSQCVQIARSRPGQVRFWF